MAKRSGASTTITSRCFNRSWSDVTEPLLYSILSRLSSNVADFYTFSGVCTAWRSVAKAFKQELLASIPPMLMLRLTNSGALRFQSITDSIHHPKPRLTAVRCLSVPARVSNLMLTEAGGDLLLVSKGPLSGRISEDACLLDLKRRGWVRLTSLGGHALFLSYNRCEVAENPAEWDGEDCIYMVSGNTVVRRSLKDGSTKVLIESLPQRYMDKYRNYDWLSPISNQLSL